jgi:copper chaperone
MNIKEHHMVTFDIDDMTCSHCAGSITDAVTSVDPGADLQFDLANHRVRISPVVSSVKVLKDVIEAAGYSPVLTAAEIPERLAAPPQGKGCCCG